MSCLASGLRGKQVMLGAALCIEWMCEGPGGGRGTEGVDGPSNMQMKARSYTSVCLSTLARAEGMPTHQLAYTPARRGERSLGGRGERGQSTSAFMFFYALSQRAFTGFCPCLREVFVCSLENFTLLSDGAVWRGCLVYKVWSEMCMRLALIFFFFFSSP